MCKHGDAEQRAFARMMRRPVHDRLVERMTTDDLRRKADLSRTRARQWTQEEIDLSIRLGSERADKIQWA